MTADVAVIGAGPAGIAAATRAAQAGMRVVLLDESPRAGGQIWRHRTTAGLPKMARQWIARLAQSGAIVAASTAVVDAARDAEGFVITCERDGQALTVRAASIILATGARERFLPFPGWTLPGVIGVGAGQALLKAGTSFRGKRVVISGSGPLIMPVAAALSHGGARVLFVAEQAARSTVMPFVLGLMTRPLMMVQAAAYRAAFMRTPYRFGSWVCAARGDGHVEEVDITNGHVTTTIACDVLCAAFGLLPNTELARLLGCAVAYGSHVIDETQRTTQDGIYSAGESTGVGGVDLALVEGEIAGLSAAGKDARAYFRRRDALCALSRSMERAFAPRAEVLALARSDTIVCRCEDVALGSIRREWTPRQAKLYTRAGMGACQGRVCGAALELIYGWPPDTVRLPAEPALFSTLIANSATADVPLGQGD
ncbi:MAG: Pyridine nucleotide-disulfide oxidoreductase, FAD/NAD(P)-binding domain protein [Gemmatimonadetes bacterium]|nr:Pyridine nucleotide-disulfide oxidoreductase, FAD/NAD(P)-binding domain protein [Gemmatimonadota bacterium]